MKKIYTKKQITEAIAYWKKQLKAMDESSGSQADDVQGLFDKVDEAVSMLESLQIEAGKLIS